MIRWGIIGCGDVCEVKSGPALSAAVGSALVSVMRRDGAKARSYARRHGVSRYSSDASYILDDPGVDALYVATPPGSHLYYAVQAAERRKPCYIEKPMARNYDECCQILEAFASAGTKVFVAYYRPSLPRFLRVKTLLEDGTLGTIRSVKIRQSKLPMAVLGDQLPWRERPLKPVAAAFSWIWA